ncbi:MAG: hypothetical protein LBN93_10605 [Candidatus Symbiothrix sp.]|jgi:hypothetical protein|nr:hypothetical protein [Candidatus Symbiothrix sp.]
MKLFQIDYKKLVLLLLPTMLRREVVYAFLKAMTAPVISLYNQFTSNRDNNLYRLQISGQVCYLRRLLNDAFPSANGNIRIEEGSTSGNWQYAYDEDYDPYQKYLLIEGGTLFWDKSTIIEGVSGFTVYVPVAVYDVNNDAKIRSLLNAYKLLSKHYTIIYE